MGSYRAPGDITINIKLEGFNELENALRSLPEKVAKKYVDVAMKKALTIVQKAEKAAAPRRTGKLAESIGVYKKSRRKEIPSATVEWGVKPLKKKGGGFAYIVEFGTKPHRIPKTGETPMLITGRRGYGYPGNIVSHVMHPGSRPRPFLNPAMDANVMAVINMFGEYLGARCEEELMGRSIGSMGYSFAASTVGIVGAP